MTQNFKTSLGIREKNEMVEGRVQYSTVVKNRGSGASLLEFISQLTQAVV